MFSHEQIIFFSFCQTIKIKIRKILNFSWSDCILPWRLHAVILYYIECCDQRIITVGKVSMCNIYYILPLQNWEGILEEIKTSQRQICSCSIYFFISYRVGSRHGAFSWLWLPGSDYGSGVIACSSGDPVWYFTVYQCKNGSHSEALCQCKELFGSHLLSSAHLKKTYRVCRKVSCQHWTVQL